MWMEGELDNSQLSQALEEAEAEAEEKVEGKAEGEAKPSAIVSSDSAYESSDSEVVRNAVRVHVLHVPL